MTAVEDVLLALAASGSPAHRLRGGKWDATCPCCGRVRAIELRADHAGRAVVKCWGGCSRDAIRSAMGLEASS